MKRYIYCLILLPIFIFGNPGIGNPGKINSYNLETLGNYPNYTINFERTDFVSTSGGASGMLSVINNTLYINFSGGWTQSVMKTGIIKVLSISPSLPDLELGPLFTNTTSGIPSGYNAKIENNNFIIYSTSSTLPLTTGTYLNTTKDLNEGNAIIIPNDNNNNWIHGVSYDSKGNAISQSRTYFDDLGKSNLSLSKDYLNNKIWGIESTYDNFGRLDKTSFIAPSPLNNFEKTNFLKSSSEIISGAYPSILPINNITSSNVYKATQSITASGTVSPGLTVSLNAPSITLSNTFLVTATPGSSFIVTAVNLPDIATNPSLANYYSDNNNEELYQATAAQPYAQINYDQLNPGNIINVVGGNKINGEWKTGYSYTIPAAQEMYYAYGSNYFYNNTDIESYIAKKEYPQYDNLGLSSYFMRTITAENQVMPVESIPGPGFNIMIQLGAPPYAVKTNYPLERGKLYKVLMGGETKIVQIFNEINYRNETGSGNININNPVTVLAGSWETYNDTNILNKVSSVFNNTNNIILDLKCFKTIYVDANGIENISFTDSEGKALASARSGGSLQYSVKSLIGSQGFIDVHLPKGCDGTMSFIGGASLYNVYNLKTGNLLNNSEKANIPAGTYRIEQITKPNFSLGLIYFDKTTGNLNNVLAEDLGVSYNVNYYDYTLNVYNKTNQLVKTIQPNGYQANTSIIPIPAHMQSNNDAFATNYTYNDQGLIKEIKNPDQGISKFAYRNDGQIRYSQSAIQADTKVSYTDYDILGRPIESGVISGSNGIWSLAIANPDGGLIAGTRSEQTFTIYDYPENNTASVPLPNNLTLAGVLATAGINITNYNQNNLSGNVAITLTKPGVTISAITWYSYDLYGRTEWIVQYNESIGAKTIHYEYDYKGNVKKVLFQKDKAAELFVHQYTYNVNGTLTKVETSTDNTTFTTHADYSYYKTGELKRVNIAQGAQGLDYVYTLGGQLKSINHPSLEASKDPGGDANDVFGLTLDYYNGDYLRTGRNVLSSPSAGADYNGNIKVVRWANKGKANDQVAYLYNYNRNNWLTDAVFGSVDPSTASINSNNTLNESGLTYDANGNIKSLKRTNHTGNTIDDLTYKYSDKNQLNQVVDNGMVIANSDDIKNQTDPQNYKYDAIGQLLENISEKLKYIYNTQGLVTEVKKDNISLVKFFYNERGQRIKKESYNTNSPYNLQVTTFYELDLSGNTMAVYNLPNGGSITQTELPIYGLSRLGIYKKVDRIASYEIKDNLGNVRAVIEKESGSPVIKSFADYYPFGELLPSRNSLNYRYAFQGQELDGETGMEAFQLRLWDGRLGRWLSPDPYGQYSSPYLGMGNNPIGMIDPDGGFAEGTGPGKGFFGRLFSSLGSVFSSSPSETTYDEGTLREVVIQGKGLPTQRLAEPRNQTWHSLSGILNGARLAEFNGKEYILDANGFAIKQNHLIKAEFPEAITFFMGGGEAKFATYSSEVLETLVSTEQIAGVAAQNTERVAVIAKKLKSKNIFDAVESIEVFVHNGKRYILDGHHRVEAGKLVNKSLDAIEYTGKEAYRRFPDKVQQILNGMF